MTALPKRRPQLMDSLKRFFERLPNPRELGGFVTNGGTFRDGPPPAPVVSPPSRYEIFAALDDELTRNMPNKVPEIFVAPPSSPPPPTSGSGGGGGEPTGQGRQNYACDVFDMAGRIDTMWRNNQILPNLEAEKFKSGEGTITIYGIERARELNQQHLAEHRAEHGTGEGWARSHDERRLIIDYTPNTEFGNTDKPHFARVYGGANNQGELAPLAADQAHREVFCVPVAALTEETKAEIIRRCNIPQDPETAKIADITLTRPSTVTRSMVRTISRRSTGETGVQYMIIREDAIITPRNG